MKQTGHSYSSQFWKKMNSAITFFWIILMHKNQWTQLYCNFFTIVYKSCISCYIARTLKWDSNLSYSLNAIKKFYSYEKKNPYNLKELHTLKTNSTKILVRSIYLLLQSDSVWFRILNIIVISLCKFFFLYSSKQIIADIYLIN